MNLTYFLYEYSTNALWNVGQIHHRSEFNAVKKHTSTETTHSTDCIKIDQDWNAKKKKKKNKTNRTLIRGSTTRQRKTSIMGDDIGQPQHTPTLRNRLQLHISAKHLKNQGGIMGISDPFAIVTSRGDNQRNPPVVIGKTDVVFNNLNPSWSKSIFLEGYKFGRPHYIEVGVFDFDAAQTGRTERELSKMDVNSLQKVITKAIPEVTINDGKMPHKMMGTALFEVGEVLGSRGNVRSKKLQTGGAIYVHIEKCLLNNETSACHFQLGAKNLTNTQNLRRKSNPFYELYRKVDRPTGATWMSVFRSEIIKHNLNPSWKETELDLSSVCNGNLDCAMKVIVWDQRSNGKHKIMGELETNMRAFIDASDPANYNALNDNSEEEEFGFTLTKRGKEVGQIIALKATLPESFQAISNADFVAANAAAMKNNGESYSSLAFHTSDGAFTTAYTAGNDPSESTSDDSSSKPALDDTVAKDTRDDHNMEKNSRRFSNAKKSNNDSGADAVSRQSTSDRRPGGRRKSKKLEEKLQKLEKKNDHGKAEQQKERRPSGKKRRPDFVDYLSGGCQISLAVAIDFTASNGDPRKPGTPHYFHPPESKEWNNYEKAIFAVGSILAKYDSDQKFPVWGFGAKYNNVVRHCFQCGTEVEVKGVQGIMDAYRGVFQTPLTMSYPTIFSDVIRTAGCYAQHEQDLALQENQLSYTILLILTAGNIDNVQETKDELINASFEPLSVVIVGIGDADFSPMEFLDEHNPKCEDGRDITKFVRFSDYKSFNALTEAVLDEIPDQVVEHFYDKKGILPGKFEGLDKEQVEIQDADGDDRTTTFLSVGGSVENVEQE